MDSDDPVKITLHGGTDVFHPRLNDDDRKKLDPIPLGAVPYPLDLPKGCKFAPWCKYCTQKCIDAEPELKQVAEGQYVRVFTSLDKARKEAAEYENCCPLLI